jgi:integrase
VARRERRARGTRRAKNDTPRSVHLPSSAATALRTVKKGHGLPWHDLRDSCASHLAQSGASLLEIASVLGHKSLQATQRYVRLIPGAKVTGHDKLNAKIENAT